MIAERLIVALCVSSFIWLTGYEVGMYVGARNEKENCVAPSKAKPTASKAWVKYLSKEKMQ